MPVQAPQMMAAQQPVTAPPVPAMTDLDPLQQRLAMLRNLNGTEANTSPTSWAGGLARIIGSAGTAYAAKQAQDQLNTAKSSNNSLLAQAILNMARTSGGGL